jgi:type IV pilus assembly protein PilA
MQREFVRKMAKRGFSLIELLIVVAVILIIAAIAIPNLIHARMAANESSAVASLRVLNNAEVTYAMTYDSGYADNLHRLGPPASGQLPNSTSADLVDQVLSAQSGTGLTFAKNGYGFTFNSTGAYPQVSSYSISADPAARGSSGQRSFFTNEPLVIRYNALAAATSSDGPL